MNAIMWLMKQTSPINVGADASRDLSDDEKRQRALDVAGRFSSGLNDVAAEHDRYLAEAILPETTTGSDSPESESDTAAVPPRRIRR